MKKLAVVLVISLALLGFQNCGQPGIAFADLSEQASLGLQAMTVEVKTENRVDILFVVDNSGSMKSIQADISNRLPSFISTIDSLDWHIAVTTTAPTETTTSDAGNKEYWGNGNFRALHGRGFLRRGDLSTQQAQEAISEAINVGIKGSGDERGINSVYSAIGKSASQADQSAFFRTQSRLVVVLISDEDECSTGNCIATKPTSHPENLLKLVTSRFGSGKVFKFNSIVKTSGSKCSTSQVGKVYMSLSERTGGVIGDVCSTDYTKIISNISQSTLDLIKSVNLPCAAKEAKVFDAQGMTVQGVVLAGGVVTLPKNLSEGLYTVQYSCK